MNASPVRSERCGFTRLALNGRVSAGVSLVSGKGGQRRLPRAAGHRIAQSSHDIDERGHGRES